MSQVTDTVDAFRRRVAVGKGLRSLPLDESQLQQALALWDHIFQSDKSHAVPHYVDTLAALLKLSEKDRHNARLSILREMITASLDLRVPPPPRAEQLSAMT